MVNFQIELQAEIHLKIVRFKKLIEIYLYRNMILKGVLNF